jgi:hypothetical protein
VGFYPIWGPGVARRRAGERVDVGELPGSAGEKKMLRLGVSLVGQAPICLGDAVTGLTSPISAS